MVEAAGTSAQRHTSSPDDASARLQLFEQLRAADDTDACAQASLAWLADHAGLDRGLFLRFEARDQKLVGAAGHGVPLEAVEEIVVDTGDPASPLAWILSDGEIVEFDALEEESWPVAARFASRLTAAPIGAGSPASAFGVLLLGGEAGEQLDADLLEWVVGVLDMRLSQLWYSEGPRLEERLRRERGWLYGLVDAVTDPVLLTDAEGRILIANKGAEALLSADETASEGRRHAVALNNMMLSAALAPINPTDSVGRRELLLVDPDDGSDLMLELLSTPLQIRPGEVGAVAILRNVTDLHRALEELEDNYSKLRHAEGNARKERDRLDLIISSVIDPIVVTNAEGEVVLMNPPAIELLTVGDHHDQNAERRVQANDVVLSSFLANVYTASQTWSDEIKLADPETGRELPIEAIGTVYTETSGDRGVVTILHDRSEAEEKARLYEQVWRHSTELEERVREATAELASQNELLRRQALELEQASAMKSRFLANVSHELRTPLNAMLGYTTVLLENVYGELTELQREKLGRVAANARHLKTIIDEVLDITKIEAGKVAVKLEEFDIAALIEEVLTELGGLIDESGLAVASEMDPDIPSLRTDPAKVKQILINLLSNALKFTQEGKISIEARLDAGRDRVEVTVTDTGIGIADEDRDTIFDTFEQSGYTPGSGAGLGLSICRLLANLLGGDISLESELGEGSSFTMSIPVRLPAP